MDSVPTTIGEQFSLLFDANDDFVFLKKEALSGRLKHYEFVHFVAWQALLGVLPTEKLEGSDAKAIDRWESECKKWREEYALLKSELVVNPHNEDDSEANDATMDNPLSTGESSTWAQYFANSELRKDIFRDVDRTYPEIDFFRETEIQEMLTMILFVYAKRHPHLAYKQGMHEICALPLYIAHRERIVRLSAEHYTPEEGKHNYISLIRTLYDPKFIEHDLYHLFSKMIEHLGPYYIQSRHQQPSNGSDASTTSNGSSNEENSGSSGSAVLRKCRLIQDVLLKKHDEQLSLHLSDIELEPQLYLLRWIRILFGREFHLEDTVTVWDAVFAFDDRFGFIDHMAVAMLIFIRSQLLARDFADCIKRLQKYPPVEDVTILVEHAIALTKPKPAGLVGPLPFPSSLPSTPSPGPLQPSANLVTVSSKSVPTPSAPTSHYKPQNQVSHGASQMASTPQKPIVYASPTYNASAQPRPLSTTTQAYGSTAPKRAAPNASDAQILKAVPLNTPPSSGAQPRTGAAASGVNGGKLTETPMVTVPKAEWEELNRQVADSNVHRSKFTTKLNTVIGNLQAVLTSPDELSSQQITEFLVMTLAGLKRTRDVASGLLGDDDDDETAMGMPLTAISPQRDAQKLKLAPAPSTPAPFPPNGTTQAAHSSHQASQSLNGYANSANAAQSSQTSNDFGMLPPADTDEWGTFTPTTAPQSHTYFHTAYTPSYTPQPPKPAGPPTNIDIPASSEASKAAVSAIFD